MARVVLRLQFNDDEILDLMVDIIINNASKFEYAEIKKVQNKGTMLYVNHSDLINNMYLFEDNKELYSYVYSLTNKVTKHSKEINKEIQYYKAHKVLKDIFTNKLNLEDKDDRNM
mgnify:FL=1|jgi:hypothetical protein